jgi:enediyne biosynthesis protein E4
MPVAAEKWSGLTEILYMQPAPKTLWRFFPPLCALIIIGVLFFLSRQPTLLTQEADALASRFRFSKLPLPELPDYPHKMVRDFRPSVHHVRSWLSFVGAAVALADLDQDGLPNDLVLVDPRIDQVIVAPAPETGKRYAPFILHPSTLPFEASTMAPMGSRVGDFNEDGRADILVYYWGRSPILFLQTVRAQVRAEFAATARFRPVELVSPHQRWYTSAVAQADLDGDGHVDLIIGNYNPDTSRVLDTAAAGVEEMMHSMSRAYNGGVNRLFLWDKGSGGALLSAPFREVPAVLDEDVARGWTFAIGAADLDGDLLPEMYFVQDFGPDRLLHNRSEPGKLRFVLLHGERTWTTPRSLTVGSDSFNGMGIDFADLNGDGWLDIFVSNITCDFGLHESNFLFLSTGQPEVMRKGIIPYRNASEAWGLSRGGWTWDVRLADFDNDGVLEVMQATGFTRGKTNRWPEVHEIVLGNDELMSNPRFYHPIQPGDDVSGHDRNPFFVRAADGRYYELAAQIGLGEPMMSRGIAPADVDGDGRLDFAVANNWEPSFLFYNTTSHPGAFLGLHLQLPVGLESDQKLIVRSGHRNAEGELSRPAIGAIATIHLPDGKKLVAQVDGGSGHSGQRAPDLHFGLGNVEPAQPLRIDLRWRGTDGGIRSHTLFLPPGWHTVFLGAQTEGQSGGQS